MEQIAKEFRRVANAFHPQICNMQVLEEVTASRTDGEFQLPQLLALDAPQAYQWLKRLGDYLLIAL